MDIISYFLMLTYLSVLRKFSRIFLMPVINKKLTTPAKIIENKTKVNAIEIPSKTIPPIVLDNMGSII